MNQTLTDAAPPPDISELAQANSRFVFVYGTLRRGEQRDINLLKPAPVFVGTSRANGTLYHLGACNYPGLRLGGTTWVHGDVYQITPELERQLDEIEHVQPIETAEYSRQEVRLKVRQPSGTELELTCLTYEISEKRALGMAVIASGDWLAR